MVVRKCTVGNLGAIFCSSFRLELIMRFYWQGAVHPWAKWFCVGGVFVGNRRISLALTKHLWKFVRDNENSWAVFFLFLRVHVIRTRTTKMANGLRITEIAAKNLHWKDDPDCPVV